MNVAVYFAQIFIIFAGIMANFLSVKDATASSCRTLMVLTFLAGVFAKLERGYVKRYTVALSV